MQTTEIKPIKTEDRVKEVIFSFENKTYTVKNHDGSSSGIIGDLAIKKAQKLVNY